MLNAAPLFRLGVAGDSLSDEYAEADYSYAHNWVESLAQDLDVGAQGTWGTPRDEGFEYNWAQAGATSTTLVADGQHTGLAQQITDGVIDYAVLAIGQNDFGPWTEAYLGIYSETWPQLQILAYENLVLTNIETALQTLTATGGKVVLSNIIDYGVAPITRMFLTDPAGRERVTDVIRMINTELVRLAQQYNVPLIDGFQATKDFLGENAAPVDTVAVGGVEFVNTAGVEPQNMFVDDGIHPHTVGQAVIANLVVEAIHLGYGQDVGTIAFSEQEMLGLVGMEDQYTGDTLNLVYPDYIILPGPPGGITVSPISRPTTEPNGTATFTIVLDTAPLADVTIALHSSDTSEGMVSPASVTFTPDNWNVAQEVTVTGADDDLVDGTVAYTVLTEPAVSTDGRYSGVDAGDVAVTNLDNDPHPWRNPRHWADTDDNGSITAGDVLVLINDINNKQSRSLPVPPPAGQWPPPFLDTDGDDAVTPNDVIRIINDINNNGPRPVAGAASGEGEGGTMLAAGVDVWAAIPAAELPRDLHALIANRAGVEESGPGDRGSVAARTVDDRWSSAASGKLAAAEPVARRTSVRDRIHQDRLATDMERDEARLLVGRSLEFEDALSEIASDIATARRCR